MRFLMIILSLGLMVGCGKSESNAPPDVPPPTKPAPPDDSAALSEINQLTNGFESRYLTYKQMTQGTNLFNFGYLLGGNNTAIKHQSNPIPFTIIDLQSVGFATGVVGVCWYRSDGTRDIQYDREWWGSLGTFQKKSLVFHENGHCQLSRDHRCSSINNGGDKSIMYPSLQSEDHLSSLWGSQTTYGYWAYELHYKEIELFSASSQSFDDCPTSALHKVNTNGDVAHPVLSHLNIGE